MPDLQPISSSQISLRGISVADEIKEHLRSLNVLFKSIDPNGSCTNGLHAIYYKAIIEGLQEHLDYFKSLPVFNALSSQLSDKDQSTVLMTIDLIERVIPAYKDSIESSENNNYATLKGAILNWLFIKAIASTPECFRSDYNLDHLSSEIQKFFVSVSFEQPSFNNWEADANSFSQFEGLDLIFQAIKPGEGKGEKLNEILNNSFDKYLDFIKSTRDLRDLIGGNYGFGSFAIVRKAIECVQDKMEEFLKSVKVQ
ncbi:MAG: hypothetical protein S4CHLAM7_06570 [Chlamydiae bacterium]|nr:hypothetical protein [Chlamydiota bacterium]